MRIAYLVNYFVPAGVENYVLTLLNHLDRSRFEPFLYVLYFSDADFLKRLKPDVQVRNFNKKSGYDRSAISRMIRQCKQDNIQVIHVNNWGTFVDGVLLKIRFPGVKLVHVQHGLEYDERMYASSLKQGIRKFLRWGLIRFCDRTISVSKAGKAYLEKEWGARNVKVIYNGIDTGFFSRDRVAADNNIPTTGQFNICTIGRLVTVKNFLCLFKAINRLKEKIPTIKLYHIGASLIRTEESSQQLAEYLTANKLEDYIKFLGKRNDVANVLAACHVFALTSLSEAISLALLESQSMGLPAVVTEVGGNPEIVEHGVNGLLVPSNDDKAVADAIWKLYQDKSLRQRMGENARQIALEKFDLNRMIRNYELIYQN